MELKQALLERLAHYFHVAGEPLDGKDPEPYIASAEFGHLLHMDETQVRRDLASVGIKGTPRLGFKRAEVIETLSKLLTVETPRRAILVGAGSLGTALAANLPWKRYGFELVGVFDNDPAKIGTTRNRILVLSPASWSEVIRQFRVTLAVLTIPPTELQSIADRLIAVGIRSFWNFVPGRLFVPSNVYVRNEHIAMGLGEIAYHLGNPAPPESAE